MSKKHLRTRRERRFDENMALSAAYNSDGIEVFGARSTKWRIRGHLFMETKAVPLVIQMLNDYLNPSDESAEPAVVIDL